MKNINDKNNIITNENKTKHKNTEYESIIINKNSFIETFHEKIYENENHSVLIFKYS